MKSRITGKQAESINESIIVIIVLNLLILGLFLMVRV